MTAYRDREDTLGPLVAEYHKPASATRGDIVLGGALASIGLGVTVAVFVAPSSEIARVVGIVIGVICATAGVIIAYRAVRNRVTWVRLHAHGLVYRGGTETRSVAYADVRSLVTEHAIERTDMGATNQWWVDRHRLVLPGGRYVELDFPFAENDEARGQLEAGLAHLVAGARAALARGERVECGAITLNRDGLETPTGPWAWAEIETVELLIERSGEDASVDLELRGARGRSTKVSAGDLHDIHVIAAIANRR